MLIADVEQVTAVVKKILDLSKGDGWGRMIEGYPMTEDVHQIPAPIITWRSVFETPAEVGGRPQIKPRLAKETVDKVRGEGVRIYTQPIDMQLRFGAWHKDITNARKLAREIEEAMLIYSAEVHSAGILQSLWLSTSSEVPESDRWRTDLTPVFIDYRLRMLRLSTARNAVIEAVNVHINHIASSVRELRERLLEEGTTDV